MADWLIIGSGNFAKELNPNAVTSNVTELTCVANDTKGAWVEVVTSTAHSYAGLFLSVMRQYTATATNLMIDIGIGAAGSELVIFENFTMATGQSKDCASLYLPIHIPTGTRIAIRGQAGISTDRVVNISIIGVTKDFLLQSYQHVETYGATVATTEGAELPVHATDDTKGAYIEITSSTLYEIKHLIIDFAWSEASTSIDRTFLIDIAVGASGSEEIIISDLFVLATSDEVVLPAVISLPIQIPAGSRISARAQQSENDNGYSIQIVLHGLS